MLRLTYERKARKWSQGEVARRAALLLGRWSRLRLQSIISRLELSQTKPTEQELEALAAIFEVQPPFVLLRQIAFVPADREPVEIEEPAS